jgi:hypothetical protein
MKRIEDQPKISVIIRKRPLLKKELARNEQDIVKVLGRQTVTVSELKEKVDLTKYIDEHNFNFDRAYDEQHSNEQIYYESVRPIVELAFLGARVTCFAYGQTGSGKTFTMNGDPEARLPGLYAYAGLDIFSLLEQVPSSPENLRPPQRQCQFLRDLLRKTVRPAQRQADSAGPRGRQTRCQHRRPVLEKDLFG